MLQAHSIEVRCSTKCYAHLDDDTQDFGAGSTFSKSEAERIVQQVTLAQPSMNATLFMLHTFEVLYLN
jgi:hypothetical protein